MPIWDFKKKRLEHLEISITKKERKKRLSIIYFNSRYLICFCSDTSKMKSKIFKNWVRYCKTMILKHVLNLLYPRKMQGESSTGGSDAYFKKMLYTSYSWGSRKPQISFSLINWKCTVFLSYLQFITVRWWTEICAAVRYVCQLQFEKSYMIYQYYSLSISLGNSSP